MNTLQQVMAMCGTTVTATAGTFSAADFCTLYAPTCTPPATGYNGRVMCEAAYAAGSATQRQCRSYHLCNASMAAPTTHCPHAVGMGLCE